MGKKSNVCRKIKADEQNLDTILADIRKIDASRASKTADTKPIASEAPRVDAATAPSEENFKWKNKKEMDALIAANKAKKNWPSQQTMPEPTVPIVKMFQTPSEQLAKKAASEAMAAGAGEASVEASTKKKKRSAAGDLPFPPLGEEVVEYELLDKQRELEKELKQEKFQEELWNARMAAQVHKTTRKWMQGWVKPGMPLQYICETTENKIRELLCADGLDGGVAFPMGANLNACAAHYSPNSGDTTRLGADDVVKFDIGVHYKGRIIDSAWTMCWNDRYEPLLEATKAATNCGVAMAGIDVRLAEIGEAIQEVMESHEIELNGKIHQIKCVDNLCGHSIWPYRIHGDKSVPIIKIDPRSRNAEQYNRKMEEFEFFAIETFSSTGRGHVDDMGECSHFALEPECFLHPGVTLSPKEQQLYDLIKKTFGTLPWARRYVDRLLPTGEQKSYLIALKSLVNKQVICDYPPLYDMTKGCYTAQFEHSFVLRPTAKEVFSRSDDY